MPINHFYLNFLMAGIITLSCGSCALSPQVISVDPVVNPDTSMNAGGKPLYISVQDSRHSRVIGYRGGVYDTAAISTDENFSGKMLEKTSEAFSQLGFEISRSQNVRTPQLTIEVVELSYRVQKEAVVWNVEINARLKGIAKSGSREITSELSDKYTREFVKAPGKGANSEMVNSIISTLLQRLVNNREQLALLTQGQAN